MPKGAGAPRGGCWAGGVRVQEGVWSRERQERISSVQDIVFPVRCVPVWWGQGWCGGSGSGACWELRFGVVTSLGAEVWCCHLMSWLGWAVWFGCEMSLVNVCSWISSLPKPHCAGLGTPSQIPWPQDPFCPKVTTSFLLPFLAARPGASSQQLWTCLVEVSLLLHPPMAVLLPSRSPTSTSAGSWGICQPRRSSCCGHRR